MANDGHKDPTSAPRKGGRSRADSLWIKAEGFVRGRNELHCTVRCRRCVDSRLRSALGRYVLGRRANLMSSISSMTVAL